VNESVLVALVPVRIFVLLGFVLFYALGGRYKKVLFRRILATCWLTFGAIALALVTGSFKWWLLLSPALYFGALSIGYGGDSFLQKVARRGLYGLFLGACSLIFASATGSWALAGLQIGFSVMGSVYLGTLNPAQNAVDEEALVAILSTLCVPFMV